MTQWEHWPTILFYIPLTPFFILRAIKAKSPVHYLTTNPNILYSGNGTESKYKTLSLVPEEYRPKGILISNDRSKQDILKQIKNLPFDYPIIAKPDIGFRGYLVKKISDQETLINYLEQVNTDIILQEFIPYHNELGIFYHRIPGNKKGKITSVTIKKFIAVIGDGKSTLSELIQNDERAFLYYKLFRNIHRSNMEKVYKKEEKIVLTEIGNHSKGTQFINGNHLINNDLEYLMDNLCNKIDGWYYGRLDIKYKDYDRFLKGKDFKILEVNGIISEPTHIYDASCENSSFINCMKTINDHWDIMNDIAVKNHEVNGVEYPKIIPYLKNMLWLRTHSKKLKALNKLDF
jgi:hypothetical protein